MLWQAPLPAEYHKLSADQLDAAIAARKAELGSKLVILGHHYQQEGVVKFADFTGDSLKLSQLAAQQVQKTGAKYVVFCGVHFMAESADILTPDDVAVILPDLSAGCSMADMASYEDTLDAWGQLEAVFSESGERVRLIPITYVNSSAAVKAVVGEHGGAVCTSSNARKVLSWAFAGGEIPRVTGERIKVLFLPDQHLGRNTAAEMGYDIDKQMCVWDPKRELGGNTVEKLLASDVILWKGHCSVHKLFRPEHVDQVRAAYPGIKVIVHPECEREVVVKADLSASTEGIIRAVENSPQGSKWAVGTEVNLVNRLAKRNPGRLVRILSECQCLCTTMYRISPQHLLWVLDNLAQGRVVNQITVAPAVRHWALAGLERMLRITALAESLPAGAGV